MSMLTHLGYFDKASLTDGGTKFIMDNLRELSREFEKYMMATNVVEDVGKGCPQDLAHDEVQPNLDGEKPILNPPHVRKKGITNARIKCQLEKKKRKKVKDASTSQAPQSTSMLQEIQVKKMRRSVKDATSSQAPQASSMIHGIFKTTILTFLFLALLVKFNHLLLYPFFLRRCSIIIHSPGDVYCLSHV